MRRCAIAQEGDLESPNPYLLLYVNDDALLCMVRIHDAEEEEKEDEEMRR